MTEPTPFLSWPPTETGRNVYATHTFGRHLMEHVRDYALEKIDQSLSLEAQHAAQKAIRDSIYGMMMLLDGITFNKIDERFHVVYKLIAEISALDSDSVEKPEIFELAPGGEGLCIGFHGWIENDFDNT